MPQCQLKLPSPAAANMPTFMSTSAPGFKGAAVVINSSIPTTSDVSPSAYIDSSRVGMLSKVGSHSYIRGLASDRPVLQTEKPDCFSSESKLLAASKRFMQQVHIVGLPGRAQGVQALVYCSVEDDPFVSLLDRDKTATFLDRSFGRFLETFELEESQVWPSSVEREERTLWNANMFPIFRDDEKAIDPMVVLWLDAANSDTPFANWRQLWIQSERVSLDTIFRKINVRAEILRSIHFTIRDRILRVRHVLATREAKCIIDHLKLVSRWSTGRKELVAMLLELAKTSTYDIAGRAFATIAEVLFLAPGVLVAPRMGPTNAKNFCTAFELMQQREQAKGIEELGAVIEKEVSLASEVTSSHGISLGFASPQNLIRAARHLEAAARVQTNLAVRTCTKFIDMIPVAHPSMNEWVTVDKPARIDLAGGWLDTPPICFEIGGTVLNAAVLVDGKRPIGSKARRIPSPTLVLHVEGSDPVICSKKIHLRDFNVPTAPACLLKAAVLCLEVVAIDEDSPELDSQLRQLGYGIEVVSWSNLPQGSGMGTSSILGGAVLEALGRTIGSEYDQSSIIHAVLKLEQMMTTGGGWQDQCGGLLPGAKLCSCESSLPLKVQVDLIHLKPEEIHKLDSHLLLIYTGTARLAANLLQDVLRRWHARVPEVVENTGGLLSNAKHAASALKSLDIQGLGRCLSLYWEQKKLMAPDAEPPYITTMFDRLKDSCYGMSLAGAGGGGFMVLITKEPDSGPKVQAILSSLPGCSATVHKANIDVT